VPFCFYRTTHDGIFVGENYFAFIPYSGVMLCYRLFERINRTENKAIFGGKAVFEGFHQHL